MTLSLVGVLVFFFVIELASLAGGSEFPERECCDSVDDSHSNRGGPGAHLPPELGHGTAINRIPNLDSGGDR